MIHIIRTLNLNRETTSILENAYSIGYEKQSNSIWQASFSMPFNDPKVKKIELLKYVEITDDGEYIGLFRIIPKLTRKNSESEYVTFQCEHVLATLLDSSLFQYHQLTNYTTDYVLKYLLDQQKHKHWKLGTVAFTRYFHYSWENENLLSALFSVPKPFNGQYRWTWDTQSYPWTLNLVEPEMEPTCRIKEGYNLRGLEIEENPMSVFNRIYPLGAGEGVNQLTIKDVNNGIPYLEDRVPGEEIKETVWADLRFTDAESLKASAQALLDKWKKPIVTWTADAADVSKITGVGIDKLKEGRVVRLDVKGLPTTDLRIMKETKNDIKGAPGDVQLEIGNVQEDLSTTQADMERRQRTNELYSVGATNILNFGYQDNADDKIPALIPFYIDDDVVNINTCELTYRTKKFRAYSQTTKGGGGLVKSSGGGGGTTATTASGGGSSQTSSSGGGVAKSTESGGGSTQTSSSGGGTTATTNHTGPSPGEPFTTRPYNIPTLPPYEDHRHVVVFDSGAFDHNHNVTIPSHTHSVSIPAHSHNFDTPNHTHSVTVPNHTHNITLPHHTHEIELPDHIHEIEHGIYELSETPSTVVIKVDGNEVPYNATSGDRISLVDYMAKDSNGKITRGRHEVEILPNGRARIEADLILRVFIQSQLGGNF